MQQIPNMIALNIAVFCFQFAGWLYHPPAGDHTSAGEYEMSGIVSVKLAYPVYSRFG